MNSVIRIKGKVIGRAQQVKYTDGTYVVRVLIKTLCGLPVLAERPFGTGEAASYASGNAASAIRKGCAVTAYGQGLVPFRHAGEAVLKLEAVDQIEHEAINHHEPAAHAA